MINMEEEQIMEKIKRYMEEKEGLDAQSCYFITKKLNEQYWEEIQEEDIEEEIDDLPEFDDIGEEPEEKKIKVKKPILKVGKKEEEKEEKKEDGSI